MPLIFCSIAWMNSYKGQYSRNKKIIDQPKRGGDYVEQNGGAHECCNFLPGKDGLVYGHVETWRGNNESGYDTEIKIENLGASKKDLYINGVDVIWIATHEKGGKRVVGWYKNAIVYKARQTHDDFPTEQHKRDRVSTYRIVARYEDTLLIDENERNLILDKNKKRTGWPGRSSIFYPGNHEDNKDLMLFLKDLKIKIDSGISDTSDSEDDMSYEEGMVNLCRHKKKERSKKLVKDFKNQLTDFSCIVCGFSFENFYGSLGKDYIEAHHLIPISSLTDKTKMKISDLVPVCSNCHRMLHRSKEPVSIKELKHIVEKLNDHKI